MTMYLSRMAILTIAFFFTPAFKGVLIIKAIIFDAFTTSLGLAPLVLKRMKIMIANTQINIEAATYFSVFICIFFAVLLVCSIAVAMFHRKMWQNRVLGLLSIIISFKGVAGDAYDHVHSLEDVTLALVIETLFYLAFSIAPVIYVSMHSNLIVGQFKTELEDIIRTTNTKLKEWVKSLVTGSMDVAETTINVETNNKKGKAQKKGRRGRSVPISPSIKEEDLELELAG